MTKRPPGSTKLNRPLGSSDVSNFHRDSASIPVDDLARLIQEFLFDCQYRGHSPRTLEEERAVLEKFLLFLRENHITHCSGLEIRQYLSRLAEGNMQRNGRWAQGAPKPLRPRTVRNHWSYLRTFFNWMSEEYPAIQSPFDRIKPPIVRADQICPFSEEQIIALRTVAKRSLNPLRDEAIVLFLLDTGVRATELCHLCIRDLDLGGHRCTVLGKGNKHRVVYFGRDTKKALWRYLQHRTVEDSEPLFMSVRGTQAGEHLTRAGLLQLIERLGKAACLQGVRCSPHTFRHTAAIRFLNAGGNVFSLQELLGHTDLATTQRYVNLAQTDLECQARRFSPVDSLKKSKTLRN